MTYEITFEDGAAIADYLTALSFRRLPVQERHKPSPAAGRSNDAYGAATIKASGLCRAAYLESNALTFILHRKCPGGVHEYIENQNCQPNG